MKLKTLLFVALLPSLALAQSEKYYQGQLLDAAASTYGSMAMCDGGTTAQIPQCDASGNLAVNVLAIAAPTVAAQFAAMDVTVPGGIGAAYANVLDLPDGTKMVLFDNQTNGDVDVSLDGGVSTHYSLKGGDTLALNLAQFGLVTTVAVWIKDGTTASAAGAFNISSFK